MTSESQRTVVPAIPAPVARASLLDRTSLLFRMGLINGIFAVGIVSLIVITHQARQLQSATTDEVMRLTDAQRYAEDADRLHDNLRGDLYAALLAPTRQSASMEQLLQAWQSEVRRFRDDLDQEGKLALAAPIEKEVAETRRRAEEFLLRSEDLMDLATHDGQAVIPQLPAFEARFAELGRTFANLDSLLSDDIAAAKLEADAARDRADRLIVWGAVLVIGVGMLLAWTITASIRRSVRDVSAVARALASGDLAVRYERETHHEIGMIGASLNALAQSLERTLCRMRRDSDHERFSKQLTEALEVSETEADVASVAARAMRTIAPHDPMEILLADGGANDLRQVAKHPATDAPGCQVSSLAKCLAVRRGSTMTFADSGQLNACPYLQARHDKPVAAACVPLSFMGKSLGVLHATSSSGPFAEEVVANLETLAFGAGTRTGTVRAFQRTQLQAMTDSLTGLMNRRALEAELGEMATRGESFAVLLADLDHFKRLNDTFGHQAGDHALRKFGELLRESLRSGDRAARWGGEEFVVLLLGSSASQAADWVDRVRARLGADLPQDDIPVFTASFGIADSSMAKEPATLLRIADTALYVAKSQGRDRGAIGRADFALELDETEGEAPRPASSFTSA